MLRVLQLSDCHFSNGRLDDKVRSMRTILERANKENLDIAVVCGDLFDCSLRLEDPGAVSAIALFSELSDICPVIAIKGNHSHDRDSLKILSWVRGRHPFYISVEPEVVWFDGAGFTPHPLRKCPEIGTLHSLKAIKSVLYTFPYPSSAFMAQRANIGPEVLRQSVSRALAGVVQAFAAVPSPDVVPRIVLFHGTVRGARIGSTTPMIGMDIEVGQEDLEASGAQLIAAGHLHFDQRIGRRIFYTGGLSFTSYGDEGRRGAWLHCIDGDNLQSDFIEGGSVPMRTFDVDLTDNGAFIEPPDWSEEVCDLKVRITVKEDEVHRAKDLDLRGVFPNARSVVTQRIVQQVVSVRCEEVRQARSLREKVEAYCRHAGVSASEGLLAKAGMLETGGDLVEVVKASLEGGNG